MVTIAIFLSLFYFMHWMHMKPTHLILYCTVAINWKKNVENEQKREATKICVNQNYFHNFILPPSFIEFFISCHIWPFRHSEANSFLFFHIISLCIWINMCVYFNEGEGVLWERKSSNNKREILASHLRNGTEFFYFVCLVIWLYRICLMAYIFTLCWAQLGDMGIGKWAIQSTLDFYNIKCWIQIEDIELILHCFYVVFL